MISIKDIYQWYLGEKINAPHPQTNLTPLQKEEWVEQNSQALKEYEIYFKNRSFVGEKLVGAPATITNIERNKIIASASYNNFTDTGVDKRYIVNIFLLIRYEIFFDESLYETVKLIYNGSMVEITGEILNFSKRIYTGDSAKFPVYSIDIKLTAIKVVKDYLLYSDYLDDSFKIKPKSSQCFIATAAYGNYEAPEVLVLRQFRDEKLLKTLSGRAFVKLYYSVSPFFATIISKSELLKKSVRQYFLEPIVNKLQRQMKDEHKSLE